MQNQGLSPELRSLYEQAQKIILGGFYALPLYDQQNHFLLSTAVKGARAMPTVSTPTFADAWLAEYNEVRTHQGRYCYGKTPMQTFLDAIPLAKEKLMAA